MYYRRFGQTELQMPVFSCGGMRYQHKWQDVKPEEVPAANQANLEATIHRALELGINHIETARGYGSSEMQLGSVLPQLDRDKLIVQTKVAPSEDPKVFRETFEKSMAYLKLDHVDLLGIHGINNAQLLEWTLRKSGCMEVAREFQRDGRVKHIGFSTHALCADIVKAINSGEFSYVNLHWYYINPFNWPAVEAATRQDMGVFIISPSDKGGMLYKPSDKWVSLCDPFTPMGFNDLYCLNRPEVHTLSIGAARPSDFDAHVDALEHYNNISEVIDPIDQRIDSALREEWGDRWIDTWWHGIRDWHEMPGEVNVFEIIRIWNYVKALDMMEFGQARYGLLGNAEHWFPGKKAEVVDQFAMLESLFNSPHKERLMEELGKAHEALKTEEQKRLSQSDD